MDDRQMRDIEIIAVIVLTILFCYFLFLMTAFFMRPKKDDVWQDGDTGPNWGKDGK
jgi:hypothetical protein